VEELQASNEQVAFMRTKIEELSKKARLNRVPELCISKTERLAHVNPFQYRISIGETLVSLWQEGKFDEADIEATLAHEIGHLMDFRRDSRSKSFRNLLFESLWLACCVVPLVIYSFKPSILTLVLAVIIAVGWGISLPRVVRRVEGGIELEADRNAALYLVTPKQLAKALTKISSFGIPVKTLGFTAKLSFLAGSLTHPSFSERLRHLQALAP
jgi:Zn-dependent protease with chaperone function